MHAYLGTDKCPTWSYLTTLNISVITMWLLVSQFHICIWNVTVPHEIATTTPKV